MSRTTRNAVKTAQQGEELRSSPRRGFPYVQRAAPMTGGQMPSADKFRPIRCKDISAGGIAVILDNPPDFEHLVFALGLPPAVKHLTARVVRTQTIERNGRTRYIVGCQFVHRVNV